VGDIDLAAPAFRDLSVAARVAVVDSRGDCRWAEVVAADADSAREELGVADDGGKEVAVADDNLVPRTGPELAVYNQVVVIPSGEAGCIGTHAAEVGAQAVEFVVL
jgi:hypothetical protein